ncbi:MAG TPA: MarR family transcriptional regulator [Steroidobacteraceae bacterium]|jgi:MarR family transcriptional regulator for hemolysin|nr:MarR family transcriptional regulator [Steroidobacteraceae bacterium]
MAARKSGAKKSASRSRAASGVKPGDNMRWMPEVSGSGELFLRRREVEEAGSPGDMNYPFSQGLTFVARRWRNLMNEELRAVGQSQARWGTLYWIAVFGDTVNQTELADRIGVEQPTLGRVLRDLEAEGLIERAPGSADRRAKVIRLTAAAKPVMKQINRIQESVRARLLRGIDPEDLTVCMAVFAQILANLDEK